MIHSWSSLDKDCYYVRDECYWGRESQPQFGVVVRRPSEEGWMGMRDSQIYYRFSPAPFSFSFVRADDLFSGYYLIAERKSEWRTTYLQILGMVLKQSFPALILQVNDFDH
jgi:hypothetical protein